MRGFLYIGCDLEYSRNYEWNFPQQPSVDPKLHAVTSRLMMLVESLRSSARDSGISRISSPVSKTSLLRGNKTFILLSRLRCTETAKVGLSCSYRLHRSKPSPQLRS